MACLDALPRLRATLSQLCTPRTRAQMTADCQFGDHDRVGIRLMGHVQWTKLVLRGEFLLKTDSGYPKDAVVNKPWQPLGIPFAITPIGQLHQSPPSPIPRRPRKRSQSQVNMLEYRDTYRQAQVCSKGRQGSSVDRPCQPFFHWIMFWHVRNPLPQSIRLRVSVLVRYWAGQVE